MKKNLMKKAIFFEYIVIMMTDGVMLNMDMSIVLYVLIT